MNSQQSRGQAATENMEIAEMMAELNPRQMEAFRLILDFIDRGRREGLRLKGDPSNDADVETVRNHFLRMVDDLGIEGASLEFRRRRDMVESAKAVAT